MEVDDDYVGAEAFEVERSRAEALAQIDRAKTAFFSNVSHEFRTPLTLMLGPLEDVLGRPEADPLSKHRDLVLVAHRNGVRLLKLVNTLLEFSRIEAGRFVIKAAEIDLRDQVASALNLFEVRAAEGKIDLKREIEADLPLLIADERALRQVLLNLISNDVKFTPEHGTIPFDAARVCTLNASPERLALRVEAADDAMLERTQGVVIEHLKRFAFREDFGEVRWERAT